MAQGTTHHCHGRGGRRLLFAMAVLLCVLANAATSDAVVVAPHALYLDHQSRSGVFYVHNPGDTPVEIEVELVFGYPVSDDQGVVRIAYFPDRDPDALSAARFVRALPRRALVPPGRRQAIRLLAQPPPGLPDGEYWSRILVTARSTELETEALDGQENLQVGLRTATRVVTSLAYRKGPLQTGVDVDGFDTRLVDDHLVVDVDMERLGEAAYLGRLEVILRDSEGNRRDIASENVLDAAPVLLMREVELGPSSKSWNDP